MNNLERISIKKWAEDDRPRERLLNKGRNHLSDAELIAILINSGNKEETAVELSKRILNKANNNLNELGKLSVKDFTKFKGIGEAKAVSIVAALELGRRRKAEKKVEKKKITSSQDAFEILQPSLMDLPHEEFWLLMLNRSNKPIDMKLVGRGGVSGTVADVKIIFKLALESLASGIIVSHNHPSGSINPSKADILLTNKLREAGRLMDIPVLDHLIIGENNYYSFADEGRL